MSATAAPQTVNGVRVADILHPPADDEALVERIAHRKVKLAIELQPPNPEWPSVFEELRQRIENALAPGSTDSDGDAVQIVTLRHVGSTSVPGLPAKPVIDIDLVLSDISREAFYVPRLEAAGFQFLLREPAWHGHRFFVGTDPALLPCNLHVWGPRCAEVERHRIFKEWLLAHDDDRDLYARVKEECARAAREQGEDMMQYTNRKDKVLKEILQRAFDALGFKDE